MSRHCFNLPDPCDDRRDDSQDSDSTEFFLQTSAEKNSRSLVSLPLSAVNIESTESYNNLNLRIIMLNIIYIFRRVRRVPNFTFSLHEDYRLPL